MAELRKKHILATAEKRRVIILTQAGIDDQQISRSTHLRISTIRYIRKKAGIRRRPPCIGIGLREGRTPATPTYAVPGSTAKLDVLRSRVCAGEELWHKADITAEDVEREALKSSFAIWTIGDILAEHDDTDGRTL